jgi:SagB-type dehydrogenase family enzyme
VERVEDIPPGLYIYEPVEHALIGLQRSSGLVAGLAAECFRQSWIAPAPAMLIITADYPRTTDHYGEMGIRFVDMEAGHAGQNLYLQAAALGLATCAVGVFSEEGVREILGSGAATPLYLFPVGPPGV